MVFDLHRLSRYLDWMNRTWMEPRPLVLVRYSVGKPQLKIAIRAAVPRLDRSSWPIETLTTPRARAHADPRLLVRFTWSYVNAPRSLQRGVYLTATNYPCNI